MVSGNGTFQVANWAAPKAPIPTKAAWPRETWPAYPINKFKLRIAIAVTTTVPSTYPVYWLVNVSDSSTAPKATMISAAPTLARLRFRATEDPLWPEEQGHEQHDEDCGVIGSLHGCMCGHECFNDADRYAAHERTGDTRKSTQQRGC